MTLSEAAARSLAEIVAYGGIGCVVVGFVLLLAVSWDHYRRGGKITFTNKPPPR